MKKSETTTNNNKQKPDQTTNLTPRAHEQPKGTLANVPSLQSLSPAPAEQNDTTSQPKGKHTLPFTQPHLNTLLTEVKQ